jgi:hypothetical protein
MARLDTKAVVVNGRGESEQKQYNYNARPFATFLGFVITGVV